MDLVLIQPKFLLNKLAVLVLDMGVIQREGKTNIFTYQT